MTADLENLLPSQETPVEFITTTDGTVAKEPSVCAKTEKKIKLKKKSTKGNEFFKEGFQQGYYQQSIEGIAKGILIGLLLSLVFFLVLNTSRKQDDFSQNDSVALFLLEEQLDGVEIVYRWPKTSEDEKNFASFVRELRFKLEKVEKLAERKVPYIIGILSHSYDWTSEDVPLLDDILNYVDFLNVETNNFYAPWHRENEMAGPLSPLYSFGNDNKSIDSTMNAYTCKTMKPSKLNVILTFGGAHWENVSIDNTQSDDLFFNIDVLVTYSGTSYRWQKHSGTSYAWRSLETLGLNLEEASWHNVAKSPYIWHPNRRSFLTFENETSLEEKMEYILSKNLGGVTIDRIDQDDDWNTLLNAVTSMDMCSGSKFKKEEVKYDCGKL
ncbi:hypothetical protein CAEBREN_14308 [Caenorhabditis brenneri]|uniref:GH18 domain-containing protein n=1 Tax=Caenorhabditis brenneri TaxID=135651 RepID=G0NN58_CAEBE|nr:hypothetical protein CAEBREN_14308 [Caenorhabditis brenneri]